MIVKNCRPAVHHGGGRYRDVAIFDAEIVEGFEVLGLKLALTPEGRRFVFAPQKHGQRFARFTGAYARQMADAAFDQFGGVVANVPS